MQHKRLFHGWVMVALTFYTQFVVVGTVFYSHGILFKPMIEDIGGSRFAFGLALPAFYLVGGLMGPLLGLAIARFSLKSIMLVGAGVLSVGFLMLSRSHSLLMFYLSFGLVMSVGTAMLGGLANPVLVSNWFERRRGTALGISQFGISASGMVMAYVTPWLIGLYGWRGTAEWFALVPVLLVAPVVWWLVVGRPEDRGLLPDGEAVAAHGDGRVEEADSWSTGQALRSRNFWLIVLVLGCCFGANGAVILKIFPHATDLGYSPEQASLVLSLMAGLAAVGKPLFGFLGDHIDKRLAMSAVVLLQGFGLLLIIFADSHLMLVGAALLFGLGYGGVMPVWGVLLGTCFGRLAFGRIMGLMGPMIVPLQILGVPTADWVFDRTGSYIDAFVLFLGVFALAQVAVLCIRVPAAGVIPEVDSPLPERSPA